MLSRGATLFNRILSRHFLCVGLCPTRLTFCRRCGRIVRAGFSREASIAWTRVHAIIHSSTCLKKGISENDQEAYVMTRGGTRYVGSPSRFDHRFIGRWLIGRSRSSSRASHRSDGWQSTLLIIVVHWIGGSRPSIQLKLHRTAGNDRGRTPRLLSDRTAIAVRSSHDRGSFFVESKPRS